MPSCLFFKQKTAYELRISDWSSDVCSSDLPVPGTGEHVGGVVGLPGERDRTGGERIPGDLGRAALPDGEHALVDPEAHTVVSTPEHPRRVRHSVAPHSPTLPHPTTYPPTHTPPATHHPPTPHHPHPAPHT